jgi:hypothetical protein
LNVIIGSYCDFQVGLFEHICDEFRLSADEGKFSQFTCCCGCLFVGSGDFTWWVIWVAGVDREGAVEHDVDGVLFYSILVFVQVVCV